LTPEDYAPDPARLRVLISGRVQGVGFRYFAQRHGAKLGLSGLVRNAASGDVEVLAEGPRDVLHDLINLLREGPRLAFIAHIAVEWSAPRGDLPSPFSVAGG
jgi:acylphosphatase